MLDAERILDSPTVKKITHKGEEDPVAAMDHLVGLPKIKNQMREMAARMQYELQEYEKTGKKLKKGQTIPHSSMHMCFFGPPGTGKTTCARIMTGFCISTAISRRTSVLKWTATSFAVWHREKVQKRQEC